MSQKEHITIRLTPEDHCLNCGGIVYDKYCSSCGQCHHDGRLSFNILMEDMVAKILELDSGFWRTLFGFFKPGKVIKEYIAGKRKKYMKPINFYFVMLALYLYLMSYSNPLPEPDLLLSRRDESASFTRAVNWFSQQLKLIQILTIPLFAFYTLKAYKKWEYNYFEHISLWLYCGAYSHLISIVSVLFCLGYNFVYGLPIFEEVYPATEIATLYSIIVVMQTFDLSSFKGFLKASWTVAYCFILVTLLIVLGASLIFGLIDLYFLNPKL